MSQRGLTDAVAVNIRQAILAGRFAPGQQLREVELAQELQVSRGPVREALIRLEQEGLVQVRWHRGATVVRLSLADAEEVYTLRAALETLAVRFAVLRATDAEIDELEALVNQMQEAVDAGRHRELIELDVEFHDRIYRASRHQRLITAWNGLRSQVALFLLNRQAVSHDYPEVVVTEHAAIARALRAREEAPLQELVEEHLRGAYNRLSAALSAIEAGDDSRG
ncbi:GntR family transcriptional regulator [Carbonactinospora thermoautotrophica]|uniref:GntR family transcriptional regulator n=1 Tax=Carbonactinospora thermoautotrophica TaxID=1469144 RepID=UPI001E2FB4C4|nr:GntR family transcriptional regulator [Carbonactinospora thermoautotrophica]